MYSGCRGLSSPPCIYERSMVSSQLIGNAVHEIEEEDV